MILLKKNTKKAVMSAVCTAVSAVMAFSAASVDSSAVSYSSRSDTDDIEIVIDTSQSISAISRYIYGLNVNYGISGVDVSAVKQTGVELSSYNWETNASNSAASDGYENSIDLISGISQSRWNEPALYTDALVSLASRNGIPSRYVTLQMMGYVANDTGGTVTSSDSPKRWAEVLFDKNDSLLTQPDVHDDTVYMDEYVSYLANTYGYAADGGINGYFLDSEPETWAENYAVLGLSQLTSDELISRSSKLAYAVKKIDPTAIVYGPSVSGLEGMVNLSNQDDWEQYKNNYSWFIDYYLDKMREASDEAGIRLLDVLDIHYISDATSVLLEPIVGTDSVLANEERMQAVRILWDSSYTGNSSSAILYKQHTPIIPTIQASIRMYYPNTKLSFSEYNFGGGNDISGGIAEADVLGIFGEQGVYMACLKPDSSDFDYQKSGINIYTNYDGNGACYGNIAVYADNGGDTMSSVYASVVDGSEKELKSILINKDSTSQKLASVKITSDVDFHTARVYSFNEDSPEITLSDTVNIKDNSFEYTMDPLTVYLFEFDGDSVIDEYNENDSENSDRENEVIEPYNTDVPEHAETSAPIYTVYPGSDSIINSGNESDIVSETTTSISVVGTDESGEIITEIITETAVPSAESAKLSESEHSVSADDDTEKNVPVFVKIIVSLLVAAVAAVMIVILLKK